MGRGLVSKKEQLGAVSQEPWKHQGMLSGKVIWVPCWGGGPVPGGSWGATSLLWALQGASEPSISWVLLVNLPARSVTLRRGAEWPAPSRRLCLKALSAGQAPTCLQAMDHVHRGPLCPGRQAGLSEGGQSEPSSPEGPRPLHTSLGLHVLGAQGLGGGGARQLSGHLA